MAKYRIPKSEDKEFDLLIQRANRRIKSQLKTIDKYGITQDSTKRSLIGIYSDPTEWQTQNAPFSRSKTFKSEKEYLQFKRHVSQWGGEDFERSEDRIREKYVKVIIQALNKVALTSDNGGIFTKTGRLPGNLAKKIRELSLEQLTNFFEHADPTEALETQGWGSDKYIDADRKQFVDVTVAHINTLKELFPESKAESKKTKPKKRKAKKGAKKRKSKKKK